jgi:hypothetical protein
LESCPPTFREGRPLESVNPFWNAKDLHGLDGLIEIVDVSA